MSQHFVRYRIVPTGGIGHGGSRQIAGNIEALPDGGSGQGGTALVSVQRAPVRPSWVITQGFRPKLTAPPVVLQGLGR